MNKQEIAKEIGKSILKPIGLIQGVCIVAFLASPFVWLWFDFSLAWRVGLSGLGGSLLMYWIYRFTLKVISDSIDEYEKKEEYNPKNKSSFQNRLNEAMEKQRKK